MAFGGQLGRSSLGQFELGAVPSGGGPAFHLVTTSGRTFAGFQSAFGAYNLPTTANQVFYGNTGQFGNFSLGITSGRAFTGTAVVHGAFTLPIFIPQNFYATRVAVGAFNLQTTFAPNFLAGLLYLDTATITGIGALTGVESFYPRSVIVMSGNQRVMSQDDLLIKVPFPI